MAQEPRKNEGDVQQITQITSTEKAQEPTVIDLTQNESGDIVRPSVIDARSKKDNFSSCYEGNSCDARQHIDSINPDPNAGLRND